MNKIVIDGEIGVWGINSKDIISQLDNMNGDVIIEINSPGGSVFEGIVIFNAIKAYEKGNIEIIITGLAASIASYIALAGDTVKAYNNATSMIHNAWTFAYGDANELRKTATVLDGLTSIIAKKYQEKTNQSKENIKSLMDNETYFFGDEILQEGFCDEIVSTDISQTKEEAVAVGIENFKACCTNQKENYSNDEFVQMVAKLNKDGVINLKEQQEVVLDDTKQEFRARQLDILKKEIQL